MSNSNKFQVAGFEWAHQIDEDFKEEIEKVSLIEIIPDNFFTIDKNQEATINLIQEYNIPVIIHSVDLSILTIEKLKTDYFKKIIDVSKKFSNILSFSDHLCMTEVAGMNVGQLTPAPFNKNTFQAAKEKINIIQDMTKMPFAIENISHPFFIPNQEYEETEFINKLINETGCKLLLDVNNLHTNSVNYKLDPLDYIDRLQLAEIDSIHLAGGFYDEDNILQDGHCESVPPEVWELFEYVITKAKRPIASIVERTGNNTEHGIRPILEDVDQAQKIMDKVLKGFE